jgi:class 3 adenylate cyclase/YHS domain-containing protein
VSNVTRRAANFIRVPQTAQNDGTFVFADIAGYTALTEAHGDADAAELAATFCREISEVARASGGEVIKTIGDAVMVRHRDPAQAVLLGLTAAHDVMAGHGFPAVRVGMHHGTAIEREGDWFGATVNLAARVAAVAAGGEVLVTNTVRDAAEQLEGVEFESRGHHRMRNVALPVPLFAALPDARSNEEHHTDPVCRMLVAEGREAGTLRHRDERYCFCSLDCARQFLRDPDAYTAP